MQIATLIVCLLQSAITPVTVVFETTMGGIVIEVNVAKAPLTSANFLRYVDEGWYTGGRFHRTVRPDTETNTTHPIQVIQAGRRHVPRAEAPTFPPVGLERTKDTGLAHVDGAVSMARVAGRPDSAGSDFFIAIGRSRRSTSAVRGIRTARASRSSAVSSPAWMS